MKLLWILEYSQLSDSNWAYCFIWNTDLLMWRMCIPPLSILKISPTIIFTFAFKISIKTMYIRCLEKVRRKFFLYSWNCILCFILLDNVSKYTYQLWSHLLVPVSPPISATCKCVANYFENLISIKWSGKQKDII